MKNITHYLKMLTIACLFAGAKVGYAQTPCTPSFVDSLYNNGTGTFYGSAPGSNTATPGMFYWICNSTTMGTVNPITYTFPANGVYTITLVYVNSAFTCSASISQTIAITTATNTCGLNAFAGYGTGSNGLINFTNLSTGTVSGTTYIWSFGDSSPNSTATSPIHTYSANGYYNVTLIANNNSSPACTNVYSFNAVVNTYTNNPCGMNANFTYTQSANGLVNFSNLSTGTNSTTVYSWYFGDNSAGSTATSPVHTYSANGSYNVYMIASNTVAPYCTDSIIATVTVNTYTCFANASFSLAPTSTPQYWNAFLLYPANVTSAIWSWGDGSTDSTLYASHTYSAAGTYSICLTVYTSCGGINTWCGAYAISKTTGSTQDLSMVHVNVVNLTTGIKNAEANDVLYSVSPNPSNGSFNLNMKGLSSGNANISVYNIVGEQVYKAEATTNNGSIVKDIQLDQVPGGVYFIKVNSDSKTYTKKIIVQKQ